MKENYAIVGYKMIGESIVEFYKKNKAHIFTALGIGGTITTGILSAKDGAKAARRIDERERELGRRLTRKEKIKLCWKDFGDAAAVAGLACFSEFKSDQINSRTIADRTTLLIASEKAYEKLSKKTREVLGEKKAEQVRDEIAKEEARKECGVPNPNGPGYIIAPQGWENAPRCGNGAMFPFIDGYSNIRFWSNIDYVNLCINKLQNMMAELAPRGGMTDYYDKEIGVRYFEWLSMINVPDSICRTPERMSMGWNKGFHKDGSDDDPISIYRTTVEDVPGFAVTVINWEKKPTDMRNGRLIKSSEM